MYAVIGLSFGSGIIVYQIAKLGDGLARIEIGRSRYVIGRGRYVIAGPSARRKRGFEREASTSVRSEPGGSIP